MSETVLAKPLDNEVLSRGTTKTGVEREHNKSGRLLHGFKNDELEREITIVDPQEFSNDVVNIMANSVFAFAAEYGWVGKPLSMSSYCLYIPDSDNAANNRVLHRLVEYVVENEVISLSRKFAVLKSLFLFYEQCHNLFTSFDESVFFVEDMLSKQVEVIDFREALSTRNMTWKAVEAYHHPLYHLLSTVDAIDISGWTNNLVEYAHDEAFPLSSWEEYRWLMSIASNVLYGDSETIDEAVAEYSTEKWGKKRDKGLSTTWKTRVFVNALGSSTIAQKSMNGDDIRNAYDRVENYYVLDFIGNHASVFSDDCWKHNTAHCADLLLWLMNSDAQSYSTKNVFDKSTVAQDFVKFAEEVRRPLFSQLKHVRNVAVLREEMKNRTAFFLDMIGEELFEEYVENICLSDFMVLASKLVYLNDLEALLRYKEAKDEWDGIPLHLALELV